jgi:Methyltransferase domain
MKNSALIKTPIVGVFVAFLWRFFMGSSYLLGKITDFFVWLFKSKEITNFTYELQPDNRLYLGALLADLVSVDIDVIVKYFKEVEDDAILHSHIRNATAVSEFSNIADENIFFGRRIGWYALVRVMKPKVVVETGVDKGLGSCLLAAALKKNQEEGHGGYFYGTDINPDAGYLLSGVYADYGRILYGDSIASLKCFDESIDLFINDSDHSAAYEAEEYNTIENKLSPRAIILGDNSHCTSKLFEFSLRTNRSFAFFQEKPSRHWYPGAGIGISFNR